MQERTYLCIYLKFLYESVECVGHGLNPLTTNFVVADMSRAEKVICLAVSPSLKAYGIPRRSRLFEVIQQAKKEMRKNGGRFPATSLWESLPMQTSVQIIQNWK